MPAHLQQASPPEIIDAADINLGLAKEAIANLEALAGCVSE